MKRLELTIRGEKWVSYPVKMRFPKFFLKTYPFRGRGMVSRVLYSLNKLHLDRLLLRSTETSPFVGIGGDIDDVAFFWPSKTRSTGRFYGYMVDGGRVCEYWKIGVTEDERNRIKREARNSDIAAAFADGVFMVAKCHGVEDSHDLTVARYDPLPEDADWLPTTDESFANVERARLKIEAAGYRHGDFGWHNVKIANGKLWILDWEEMSRDLPKLTDVILLETSYAYYRQRKPLICILEDFTKKYLEDKVIASDAIAAVEDLHLRKMSMGDILHEFIMKKGLVSK